MRDWVNNPCEHGCDCGECYSRSPDQEDSHHCIERGYEKLAAQQNTDEERAIAADRRARRDRNRQS